MVRISIHYFIGSPPGVGETNDCNANFGFGTLFCACTNTLHNLFNSCGRRFRYVQRIGVECTAPWSAHELNCIRCSTSLYPVAPCTHHMAISASNRSHVLFISNVRKQYRSSNQPNRAEGVCAVCDGRAHGVLTFLSSLFLFASFLMTCRMDDVLGERKWRT